MKERLMMIATCSVLLIAVLMFFEVKEANNSLTSPYDEAVAYIPTPSHGAHRSNSENIGVVQSISINYGGSQSAGFSHGLGEYQSMNLNQGYNESHGMEGLRSGQSISIYKSSHGGLYTSSSASLHSYNNVESSYSGSSGSSGRGSYEVGRMYQVVDPMYQFTTRTFRSFERSEIRSNRSNAAKNKNYQLSTVNYQLSTINYQLSINDYRHSTNSLNISCSTAPRRAPVIGGEEETDPYSESTWGTWLQSYYRWLAGGDGSDWEEYIGQTDRLEEWWNTVFNRNGDQPNVFSDFQQWALPVPSGMGILLLLIVVYLCLKVQKVYIMEIPTDLTDLAD